MGITCDVTRRALTLGTRDTLTGWRKKCWTETTIEGILLPRTSQLLATSVGTYVRTEALFMTMDGVLEGDEVKSATNQYYEVHATREFYVGDSFSHRECDLVMLPMHVDIDISSYVPTVSAAHDDARHRQKVYLETYWTSANCLDDAGNPLGVIFMYANPDYPLSLELASPSAVDVIVTLDKPESKPLKNADYTTYGYQELVPIGIWSMDKTDVTAVKAVWQCEKELRRILETYPTGSLRGLDKTTEETKRLGTATLYNATYKLDYLRDTS